MLHGAALAVAGATLAGAGAAAAGHRGGGGGSNDIVGWGVDGTEGFSYILGAATDVLRARDVFRVEGT